MVLLIDIIAVTDQVRTIISSKKRIPKIPKKLILLFPGENNGTGIETTMVSTGLVYGNEEKLLLQILRENRVGI
ncbi:hypothetical protein NQ318_021069 [Aromia moschata]|uniref:Uncharacterized protein n=1 Tax=Aromia moschata TaxID=1265417 RepID=A0AAV8Y8X1_9CUCU|nr:hypothetical protein NQ318_021069 [Aromia moschata]